MNELNHPAVWLSIGLLIGLGYLLLKIKWDLQEKIATLAFDKQSLSLEFSQQTNQLTRALTTELHQMQQELGKQLYSGQIEGMKHLLETLHSSMTQTRSQISEALTQSTQHSGQLLQKLTQDVNERLREINGQVEKRLAEGFEKTTATFADVVKRLALIDEAQKKITELSGNVVSLQSVLNDKRSRGAFGEVQLSAIVRNILPEHNISFQHTLSNGKRADCILFLPPPSGNIVIDAKFPLESFQKLSDLELLSSERKIIEQQFRQDIRKHIEDVAAKYILPPETADGAMLFIPAEAVFAEIHSHYPDLVELANQKKVWMVSPTTMMAVLTTARAVIKDAATRKQVHMIQEHLILLARDFERFQKRMDNLSRHIHQAKEDVDGVHTSARKLTSRFEKIEKVDIEAIGVPEEIT